MLRLKYYSLSKDEKIKLKENFYKTEYGKTLKNRLDRVFITGILGIIFSIILFIFNTTKWDIVTGVILLFTSIVFIISSHKVRINKINTYLTKKKK